MKSTYQLIKEKVKALEEENEYLKKQYHKTNLMLADICKQDAEKEKYLIELCGRINEAINYINDRVEDINNGGNESEYRSIVYINKILKGE